MTDAPHRARGGAPRAPLALAAIAGSLGGKVQDRAPGLARFLAATLAFARERPLRFLGLLTLCLSFLFMAVPGIDLTVSGWFADGPAGFPLAEDETLRGIRDLNRFLPKLLLGALGLILLLHALSPSFSRLVRPHKALFVLSLYGLAGGVAVHALKNVVGRARPQQIVEFGGDGAFSVAWQLSDACTRNCSFSSGEAASAMAMLAFALLLPRRYQMRAFALLLPVALLFSLNRIAFGSHFLSDVVMSWLIVLMVGIWLWRRFRAKAEAIDRAVLGCGRPAAATSARWLRARSGQASGAIRSARAAVQTSRAASALTAAMARPTARSGQTDTQT